MADADSFPSRAIEGILDFGGDFFGVYNNQMHGLALGAIAKAAVQCGFGIAIDKPQRLARPFQGKTQRQHQARPDLVLYDCQPENVVVLVEYESTDITRRSLKRKRHLLVNWPPALPYLKLTFVAMTVPHKSVWPDTPSREGLEKHRQLLIKETSGLPLEYCFLLIDSERGVDMTRFGAGRILREQTFVWRERATATVP